MHLNSIKICHERFPTRTAYPFRLPTLQQTQTLAFTSPITFFVGENGTGKSTLLEAICKQCGITIWEGTERRRLEFNPHEKALYKAIRVAWRNGPVPGSYFGSQIFQNFAELLDEWAAANEDLLDYFGGKSLITQSHGQSLMSFFKARYRIRGLFLMDEPETALSPKSQLELVRLLKDMSLAGHAQFIVATHSPILMAASGARIYSFDEAPIHESAYEDTEHFKIYRNFMMDRDRYLS